MSDQPGPGGKNVAGQIAALRRNLLVLDHFDQQMHVAVEKLVATINEAAEARASAAIEIEVALSYLEAGLAGQTVMQESLFTDLGEILNSVRSRLTEATNAAQALQAQVASVSRLLADSAESTE